MPGRPKVKKLILWNIDESNVPKGAGNITALDFPLDRPDLFDHFGGAEWELVNHTITKTDEGLMLSMFFEQEIPAGGIE